MAQKSEQSIINKIFNLENFQIAFEKVKNNLVGSIFEGDIELTNFEKNRDLNLLILIEKALNRNYQRYPYYKYEKKKSQDEMRILYELHYTDQIIIQSILNILGPDLDGKIYDKSYGNRLDIKSNQYIFKDWRKQYSKCHTDLYNEVKKYIDNSHYYLINSDIKDFYNCILTDKLIRILEDFNVKNLEVKELIKKFFYQSEKGLQILPQGPAFSHLLANLYLSKLDDFIIKRSIDYYRYVDDIWIIFKVDNVSETKGIEEIKDFLDELNSFLKNYNLKIHEYSKDNEGKTRIYNIKKVHEELIETLIVKTYGAFIDLEGSEDVNRETLEFSAFLFLLEEESDKMNIDEFLHKNSFRILTFIKNRYERQKQEIIIYELLELPKIQLKKAIILFSILLEIRNFDITHETYEYILESPDFLLIPFLLALKEKVIDSINDTNNLIFKLLKNLIAHPNSNFVRELAFKKYIRILMNKYFLEFFNRNIPEIIKLTKNSIKLKKIVLLFTNKVGNLLEDSDIENFFQICSNLDLKKVEIRDIILIEDFLHILSFHRECLKIYQKSKEFLSLSFNLFNSNLISSNPQIFTFLIIIFLRIPEENSIKNISKIYQDNSKLFDFKIDIIIRSKIILSEIYQAKNFEFTKSEKKRYIQYIKDSDNIELQDIVFLNMKEYFFIESPEEKDSIKDIIPFVYHFRDIYYYNNKTDEMVFTEVISYNTIFSYDISLLESCYRKLFSNVLKIETKEDKYILRYTVHRDYQPLRDLVEVENNDVSDKQFIEILMNLVEKLALLDDQDILAFLNFDNIYFNPGNLDVTLIFIGPNLFRKLYYFSLEKEKHHHFDSHREKKIYRIIRNIIFEYFSRVSIISNFSLIYEDFYKIINEKIYNPYLNYIFKRSSYESDHILFDNFRDYALLIKKLATLWDFYKDNQDFCDILEIFDFDLFLIERFFHIIKNENASDFYKIYRIFNYYHKYLLNITILRNFFIKPEFNWPWMVKIKGKKFPVFTEINNYINQSKKLDSKIKGRNIFEINSLRFRKFCYFSLFYSYIELIFRALYYICLRDNLIEQLKTNDKNKKIDLGNEGLHYQYNKKNLHIDINQIRDIIEKLDINRSEIVNIMKEVPLNDFLLLMTRLIITKKLKKKLIFNKFRLNLKSLISHSNCLERIFNYPIIQRVIRSYNDIISLPLNKKDFIFSNIINFLKSKDNFLNYSFSFQIKQMLNNEDNTLILNKNIRILTEIFFPLFKKIKKKKVRFKKFTKIGKGFISKKYFLRKEYFYNYDLPLISLLPRQLIKDEQHCKYVLKKKFKDISVIYNYPISQICFNNKRYQSKRLILQTFISDFNKRLKQYKFGDTISLNYLMNEFNLPNINRTEFIIRQCIKEKKIIKKIGFRFNNELIIKEKRRHKIWRGIKKFILKFIIFTIIGSIIAQIIVLYILSLS